MRKVGFYWVKLAGDPEPLVGQWTEWGAWTICGSERDHADAKVEVLSGVLRSPDQRPTREEMLERAAERVAELASDGPPGGGLRTMFVAFRVWTLQRGRIDFDQLATYLGCDRVTAVSLCLCKMPHAPGDVTRIAEHFHVNPGKFLVMLEDPAFAFPAALDPEQTEPVLVPSVRPPAAEGGLDQPINIDQPIKVEPPADDYDIERQLIPGEGPFDGHLPGD